MKRPSGENELRGCDRDHLRSLRAVSAVEKRGAAIHRHRLDRPKKGALPHQEVRLHPRIATRRYRNPRRVPWVPESEPCDDDAAFRGRWCKADLYRDALDHTGKQLRPTTAEKHDRALRAVVNGDQDGETPSRDATDVVSLRPRVGVAPRAASGAALDTTGSSERILHERGACAAAAEHHDQNGRAQSDEDRGIQSMPYQLSLPFDVRQLERPNVPASRLDDGRRGAHPVNGGLRYART